MVYDILRLEFFDRKREFRSCIYELECKICSHRGWFGLVRYRSLACKLARGKCNDWNGRNCVDQNLSQGLSGKPEKIFIIYITIQPLQIEPSRRHSFRLEFPLFDLVQSFDWLALYWRVPEET